MTELRTAHTADLGAAELAAIRSLMDDTFDGVSDDTFDNALGGVHARRARVLRMARASHLTLIFSQGRRAIEHRRA